MEYCFSRVHIRKQSCLMQQKGRARKWERYKGYESEALRGKVEGEKGVEEKDGMMDWYERREGWGSQQGSHIEEDRKKGRKKEKKGRKKKRNETKLQLTAGLCIVLQAPLLPCCCRRRTYGCHMPLSPAEEARHARTVAHHVPQCVAVVTAQESHVLSNVLRV